PLGVFAELLLHVILLVLVAREHDHPIGLSILQYRAREMRTERTRPPRDQDRGAGEIGGLVTRLCHTFSFSGRWLTRAPSFSIAMMISATRSGAPAGSILSTRTGSGRVSSAACRAGARFSRRSITGVRPPDAVGSHFASVRSGTIESVGRPSS